MLMFVCEILAQKTKHKATSTPLKVERSVPYIADHCHKGHDTGKSLWTEKGWHDNVLASCI